MSIRHQLIAVVILTFILSVSTQTAPARRSSDKSLAQSERAESQAEHDRRMKWFREARFGMFIHWGLYSVPAGEWNGKLIPGLGEWIMNRAKIPVSQYEKLTTQFNPVKFNADAWVKIAADAGMKYLVITSKHHDGFAMYGSKASHYNIVDATPFGRDPLKELAAACQKAGIKFGFYYSQTQDWHEPDGVGNDWDWPDDSKKDFSGYLERKVKPQVRELLTNYGPIGLIWFDTPRNMTKEQSQQLADLVHSIQPDCLVSGRVGNGVGDYDSAGDNQISVGKVTRDWETPVTLNDTWGFKKDDTNWKSPAILIRQMVQVISRGGNYLLNVGPTSEGLIPQPSVERLAEVGQWLRVNKEAVYGNGPSPFAYELPWGLITARPGKIYLHVFDWPQKELVLYGLKSKVQKAYLLATKRNLKVTDESDKKADHYGLRIQLTTAAPDKHDSIIVLDIKGEPIVESSLIQQPDRSVTLPAFLAEVHKTATEQQLRFDSRGVVERWLNKDEWMSWDFKVNQPASFDVIVLTSEQKYGRDWEGNHRVIIDVAGQHFAGVIAEQGKEENPSNPYWKYVISRVGTVRFDKAGKYNLALRPELIQSEKKLGLTLVSIKLVPTVIAAKQ